MSLLLVLALLGGDDPWAAVLQKLRERVAKSVVAIEVEREPEEQGSGAVSQHRDYYNRPPGPTSGLIYGEDGFILTSRWNVEGKIRRNGIKVVLPDGRKLDATPLGYDAQRDIALLKVEASGLPLLPKADFAGLAQGTFVALVGRSPEPANATVNAGVLSALSRMENAAVQTDAEMNYGNVGGPLVTLKGELIGLACNINPGTVWGQSGGVGFACKVSEIDALLERLKKGEKIEAEKKPFLGIRPGEGDPEVEGLQIAEVLKDSPAEKAGIKKDDVMVDFAGEKITDFESFKDAIRAHKIGEEVTLKLMRRAGKKYEPKSFTLKLDGKAES